MSRAARSIDLTATPSSVRDGARVGRRSATGLAGVSVWHADELAQGLGACVPSGHAALDAELPGGGWPLGALTELLQPAPEAPVWPLLLPAVAARQQASGGAVVLVNPPHEPFVPALVAGGLPAASLLWLRTEAPAAPLWAAEQALRCADVAAVLAWLPRARTTELRRLQQAAAQTGALLFVLRPDGPAAAAASPARLRLRVGSAQRPFHRPRLRLVGEGDGSAPAADTGLPHLRVELLKRRGPPLDAPLWLPACDAAVAALAQAAQRQTPAQAGAVRQREADDGDRVAASAGAQVHRLLPAPACQEKRHALAGLAVVAA